jgi:hypothetical protein
MLVREIRKDGFYTNGEVVLFKNKSGRVVCFQDCSKATDLFLAKGNVPAFFNENVEVREIVKNEQVGEIKIIDKKTVELTNVICLNAKYDVKGYCINSKDVKYESKKIIVKYSEVK